MGIKNLTEAEEKEFYRLVEKMNGEKPDKEQGVKVKGNHDNQKNIFVLVMMELLYKAGGRMIL